MIGGGDEKLLHSYKRETLYFMIYSYDSGQDTSFWIAASCCQVATSHYITKCIILKIEANEF